MMNRAFSGSGKLWLPSLAPDEEKRLPPELEEWVIRQNPRQGFGRALLTRVSLCSSGRLRVEPTLLARSRGRTGSVSDPHTGPQPTWS